MVVAAFLSGLPLTPQISSICLCFASFGLVSWPRPFVGAASLYLYSVLGCGGQFGLCHPLTVQGTGSLGVPLFLPE